MHQVNAAGRYSPTHNMVVHYSATPPHVGGGGGGFPKFVVERCVLGTGKASDALLVPAGPNSLIHRSGRQHQSWALSVFFNLNLTELNLNF